MTSEGTRILNVRQLLLADLMKLRPASVCGEKGEFWCALEEEGSAADELLELDEDDDDDAASAGFPDFIWVAI